MKNQTKRQIQDLLRKKQLVKESALTEDDLIPLLRRKGKSVSELSQQFEVSQKKIKELLKALEDRGLLLYEFSGKWQIEKTPGPTEVDPYYSRKDNTYKFGFSSDQHICSKYFRQDVLEDLYDKFEEAGVDRVFNGGNFIDGEARFNMHDLEVHGMDNQIKRMIEVWPRRQGLVTYAVSGDDHEGWYGQKFGIDIGRHVESMFLDAGRTDFVNLGFMEAFVPLVNRNTGVKHQLLNMHPGGGSAYALSYRPQKITESLSGGEKPAVILIAHYHKMSYNVIRNVHVIQTGTTEDQTPFLRKKSIEAHVGGGICELEQDPDNGSITSCKVQFFNYYERGFYNNRWSHAGSVTKGKKRTY